jgi:hypothetical protein
MWRIAAVALLLVCTGCASQRMDLPKADIQFQTSQAFFDPHGSPHESSSWADH